MKNSRIPGFYQLDLAARREALHEAMSSSAGNTEHSTPSGSLAELPELDEYASILEDGGLSAAAADKIVENVIGRYSLPFGVALNAKINGRDRAMPMVVEEPSVIAAASNANKMIRAGGGYDAEMLSSEMIAQIELREAASEAAEILLSHRDEILARAAAALPGLIRRGGGPRDIEIRNIGERHLVLHLICDTGDAMGANLVNSAAEAIGDWVAELAGAQLGLRILTNLTDRRMVQVKVQVPHNALVSSSKSVEEAAATALAIEKASIFAERDPYRAATHNKGIMNGIDSVVIATGNDYRAVEAGAHAFAARNGTYQPLATWRSEGAFLKGELCLPLSLGTVGGTLRVHPSARLALALGGIKNSQELCCLAASAGVASNLAALRALATEGIQRGHMSLHARSVAIAAGAEGDEVDLIAKRIAKKKEVNLATAKAELNALRR